MLERLFKKLRENKGLTGADVAVSIVLIVLTVSVVSVIYVNATDKSKESIRYSAATRIATQIIENIQAATYDEVIYLCDYSYNSVSSDEDGYVFGVNVPEGYSAEVTTSEAYEVDIVRDISVYVTYKISTNTKSITLYTTKEKEFLEETNEPNLNLLDDYTSSNYYPIKYTKNSYVVTTASDDEWYDYGNGYYALVYYSEDSLEAGTTVAKRNSRKW